MKKKYILLFFIISFFVYCEQEKNIEDSLINIYIDNNLFIFGLNPLPIDSFTMNYFPLSYTSSGFRIGKDLDTNWEFFTRINISYSNIVTFQNYYSIDMGLGARYFPFSENYSGFNASAIAATNIRFPELDFFPSYSLWSIGWDFDYFYVDIGVIPFGIINVGAKLHLYYFRT